MELIQITENNINKEHICCAISEKKGECCVSSKKTGLKSALKMDLFLKKQM